jgi:hypothetical protein
MGPDSCAAVRSLREHLGAVSAWQCQFARIPGRKNMAAVTWPLGSFFPAERRMQLITGCSGPVFMAEPAFRRSACPPGPRRPEVRRSGSATLNHGGNVGAWVPAWGCLGAERGTRFWVLGCGRQAERRQG